jgi:hypothetical protein
MTKVDILQGTLDMLVLKSLSNDPMRGFAIALRIRQLTDEAPDRRGLTLPCALQDGIEGLDQGRMGGHGEQSKGQVLQID